MEEKAYASREVLGWATAHCQGPQTVGMVDGLYSTWGSMANIPYLEGQLILKWQIDFHLFPQSTILNRSYRQKRQKCYLMRSSGRALPGSQKYERWCQVMENRLLKDKNGSHICILPYLFGICHIYTIYLCIAGEDHPIRAQIDIGGPYYSFIAS